jgi:hypothetical protein
VVTFDNVGFCEVDVNPFGPVHEYAAPEIVLAVKLRVVPEHTVPLLPAVGVEGGGFTVTVVVPFGPVHPVSVTFTEYVPVPAVETAVMTGFCPVFVKLFGPFQE